MKALERLRAEMPARMGYDYAGMSSRKRRRRRRVALADLRMSLVFVFLILAALYESWTLPVSVLLEPGGRGRRAGDGCTCGEHKPTTVCPNRPGEAHRTGAKNAILIVEFARCATGGMPLVESALEAASCACADLMTSFAFILAAWPAVMATGAGRSRERVVGSCVIGGWRRPRDRDPRYSGYFLLDGETGGRAAISQREREEPVRCDESVGRRCRPRLLPLSGCLVGHLPAPVVTAPPVFRGQEEAQKASCAICRGGRYQGRDVARVIKTAIATQRLRIAAARVEQARQFARVARSDYMGIGYEPKSAAGRTSTWALRE